jgi:hypothetical protein
LFHSRDASKLRNDNGILGKFLMPETMSIW